MVALAVTFWFWVDAGGRLVLVTACCGLLFVCFGLRLCCC